MKARASIAALALLASTLVFGAALPSTAAADQEIEIVDFRVAAETELRDWAGFSGIPQGWDPLATPGDPSDNDPPNLTQAGAHPTLNLAIHFCNPIYGAPSCFSSEGSPPVNEQLDDWTVRTPPGLLGNPSALPTCDYEDYRADNCPDNTLVGYSRQRANLLPGANFEPFAEIFNIKPVGSELARFGAVAHPSGTPDGGLEPLAFQDTLFTIRSNGDFGLDAESPDFYPYLGAAPPDGLPAKLDWIEVSLLGYTGDDSVNGTPFITNPTRCGNWQVTSDVDSYQDPGDFKSKSANYPVTGCDQVPFNPQIEVDRETTQAGAPSGYKVGIEFPDYDPDAPIYESQLKDAVVELPEGVALSAPGAEGLEGCTDAQFDKGSDDPIECPAASQVGTVKIETPVLDADPATPGLDPLEGKVYFAQPTPADPWRIFIGIEDANLRIKLEGDVEIDEQTGQITTTFRDNPQTPFTRFELSLNGGDNAVLQNPVDCGDQTVKAALTPWSDENDPVDREFTFQTTGCAAARPFAPQVPDASTDPTQAGAHTVSKLVIDRPDGQQLIKNFHLSLPAGLVGSLSTVPLCPTDQGIAGTCSEESKIGHVKADVGAGGKPIKVGGEIFLTQPFQAGDAAGLSIVVPAKTGPINLGAVVTTNRVMLRQSDGGIDVQTGDLPAIFKGIHLPLRRIEVLVDREGFFQNPTSCDPKTLVADFTSHGGATASASFTAAATGCGSLSFSPRLQLSVSGETKKDGHPALKAVVTQGAGQSAISRAEVLLPQVLRPDVPVLNRPGKLCRPEQLAAAACPAPSNLGSAKVYTPLLPEPLSGPVYIVQDPNSTDPLPRLVVQLRGLVAIDLGAKNLIRGVRTLNVFESLPDVPQTRFELNIVGGKEGILKNFVDLCENPDRADTKFVGHSGATFAERPEFKVAGCNYGVKVAKVGRSVSRSGTVSVQLNCTLRDRDCAGKLSIASVGGSKKSAIAARTFGRKSFSVASAERKTIRVKLNRKAIRQLKKKRSIRARVTATLSEIGSFAPDRQTVRLRAAKSKRR